MGPAALRLAARGETGVARAGESLAPPQRGRSDLRLRAGRLAGRRREKPTSRPRPQPGAA